MKKLNLSCFCAAFAALVLIAVFRPLGLLGQDAATLPPASSKMGVTYAADIRPLFEASCFKCHGEEKQKKGLRLDSLEAVLQGAKREKVIQPGNSAASELVKSVAHTSEDEDHWMPPEGKGDPLSAEQIGLIRAWIDQGAQ